MPALVPVDYDPFSGDAEAASSTAMSPAVNALARGGIAGALGLPSAADQILAADRALDPSDPRSALQGLDNPALYAFGAGAMRNSLTPKGGQANTLLSAAPEVKSNPLSTGLGADSLDDKLKALADISARNAEDSAAQGTGTFFQDLQGKANPDLPLADAPLKVYHGSPETNLDVVSANPPNRQYDNATSQLGAFFSPTEEGAKRYAGEAGKVYETNLSLKNPYDMTWKDFNYFQSPNKTALGEDVPGEGWGERAAQLKDEAANFRDTLQSAGHDGVIVRNPRSGRIMEISSFNDVPLKQPDPIRAYHGSPYDFDAFDSSKIGTGEGAQAFGHGLYFAEKEGVAKSYRDALSVPQNIHFEGKPIDFGEDYSPIANALRDAVELKPNLSDLNEGIRLLRERGGEVGQRNADLLEQNADKIKLDPNLGRMYEVNIHADPDTFLHWDKPLFEQPEGVRNVLKNLGVDVEPPKSNELGGIPQAKTGQDAYRDLMEKRPIDFDKKQLSDVQATQALRDAGISGIKYLDQGSRPQAFDIYPGENGTFKAYDKGTRELKEFSSEAEAKKFVESRQSHNYVVFSPEMIKIVKKYGLGPLIAGGAYATDDNTHMVPVDHDPFAEQK